MCRHIRFRVLLAVSLLMGGCTTLPETTKEVESTLFTSPTQTQIASPTSETRPMPTSTSELATLELSQPFWIGRGKIVSAIFLPGAMQVAIAWGSGVSLHTVESGQELWFQPTPANLIAFDVQPQAQVFAAALSDGSLMMFDAVDGDSRRVEGARPNAYWGDIAWSPDVQTIAFQFIGANRSDPIYLLEVASGKIEQVSHSQTGEGVIPELIWSPDGSAIAVSSLGDACPRFVDIRTGEERMMLDHSGQCYGIPPLLFLPDGQTLAVNGSSGGVDLIRFPDGERIQTLQSTDGELVGRMVEFPATSGSLFIDPGDQWVAARGGYEPCYCGNPEDQPYHPLIVWDLASGTVQAKLEQAVEPLAERHRLAAAFDGESILMLYESGEITRWTFSDPHSEELMVVSVPVRPVSAWRLSWAADGSHLAFSGRYGGVDVYATATQRLVQRFDPPLDSPALSPNSRQIALFDPEKNAELIYEVQSGRLLQTLPASPVLIGPAFSPDGQYLAYGSGSRALVAEVASGEVTTLDPTPTLPVTADMTVSRLIWSPDGQALTTVLGVESGDSVGSGVIVLWKRLGDGSFEAIYHVENVQANYPLPNLVLAVFNPSGNRIALKSLLKLEAGQTKLIVYDLEAERVIQTLEEYTPGAWINDEELLAAEAQYDTRLTRINVISGEKTVGNGRDLGDNVYAPGGIFTAQMAEPPSRGITVRHWQSGRVVARGEHEALNLLDYSWSPDGRWLALIGDDGTLRVLPVEVH